MGWTGGRPNLHNVDRQSVVNATRGGCRVHGVVSPAAAAEAVAPDVALDMSLSNSDTTHLLLAVGLLLIAAHGLGQLFARFRQPRVAGEILGGLLLGPTLFGLLLPEAHKAVFAGKATQTGLGIVYQLGLLLLMYCSGAELRSIITRSERRSTVSIAVIGNVVPFVAGLLFLRLYDAGRFLGPARDRTSFALVFALAMAVTSIPVISRIMADLGILGTRFARIVLSVAVLEDVLVYVVLNIALALVVPHSAKPFGLPGMLGIEPSSAVANGYYVALTLGFFALPALFGPGLVQKLSDMPRNLLNRSSPARFPTDDDAGDEWGRLVPGRLTDLRRAGRRHPRRRPPR